MRQISVFHTGVVADLDYSKLDNNNLVFPTADIRLTNKEGKGLIITPLKGNQKAFELTNGFLIFGAAEYNGIAYILSYNPLLNLGEIGSFPSPKEGGGFEEVYKPLMNLYPGSRTDYENSSVTPLAGFMRSDVFGFNLDYPVGDQMIVLPDYDDTVNLIFTDYNNPLRLVNSGFNQKGEYKPERNYWHSELRESIQLVKPIPENQKIEFKGIQENGNLKHGNYFFFFRYLDRSNNATVFLGESQPISLYETSNVDPNYKLGGSESSSKSIVLSLSNLDTSFSFIEFAFIRFFSGSDGVMLSEVNRVGKLFSIPPDGQVQAEITGFETIVPFTIASILEPVNTEVICQSITSQDRRIWGANWKAEPIDIELLREAALQIRLGCDDSKTIHRENFQNFYAQPDNIQYAGYFRGEAYLCKVSFKLKSGYETEAFPVKGIDARKISPRQIFSAYTNATTNEDGIIILPQQPYSPIVRGNAAHIMAITFDISQLRFWMQDKQWFKENVSEIIFLRAERKANLMYQGIATRVFGRLVIGMNMIVDARLVPTENNNASIPIMVGQDSETKVYHDALPISLRRIDGAQLSDAPRQISFRASNQGVIGSSLLFQLHNQSEEEKKIRAVFSTDYMFGDKSKISNGSKPWIVPNYRNLERHDYHPKDSNNVSFILPAVKFRRFNGGLRVEPSSFIYSVQATGFANVFSHANWIYPNSPAGLGLVNRARDASRGNGAVINDDFSQCLFYKLVNSFVTVCNRNIQVPPYFGFQLSDTNRDDPSLFLDNNSVSVYSFDPDGEIYYSLYADKLNVQYFKINNGNVLIDNINEIGAILPCYRGDSFIQTTVIKTRTWFPGDEYGTNDGFDNRSAIGASISHNGYNSGASSVTKYAHGELTEIFSENAINTALRVKTENENTFFPLVPWKSINWKGVTWSTGHDDFSVYPFSADVRGWDTVLGTGIESFQINQGNSKTTSLKAYLADNPNIPKGENLFPNRIRYTGQQEANFPILAYRLWAFNARRDFESRYGDIIKLVLLYGRLLSIQRSSIFLHFTNQEETVPSTTGEMIIGVRSILSPQPLVIAEFGSQHKFGIVLTKTGLYGWDWIKGVIWRAIPSGTNNAEVTPIDKEMLIETYVKDLSKRVGNDESLFSSNIVRGLDDMIFSYKDKKGIVSGYDVDNGEILFNVFWIDKQGTQRYEILRFSEDINKFIGTSHYPATFFFNIHNDLFVSGLHTRETIFLQNKGEYGNFFNEEYNPKFSFIVNGTGGEGNASLFYLDKQFQAMEIESPRYPFPFEKVEFETMFQKGSNDPLMNVNDFWLTPEYLMFKWGFPINIAKEGQEQFYIDSSMTGRWLKVTVTMKSGIDTFVKNIMTIFTTSKT